MRRLDVTDPSTFELPGDLRVLVNNAGIDADYLPVEHANVDDWRRIFETNVFGVVTLAAAAIPTFPANRPGRLHGHLVVDLRCRALFFGLPGLQGGGLGLRDYPARGVAPFGIRVVEILPGPVDTDMFRLSTGEAGAARFADYRGLGDVAAVFGASMPTLGWSIRPRRRRPSSTRSSTAPADALRV